MMGHKDRLISGMEYDVIFARRIYCYLVNNSKLTRYVKKSINRRDRKKAKLEWDYKLTIKDVEEIIKELE